MWRGELKVRLRAERAGPRRRPRSGGGVGLAVPSLESGCEPTWASGLKGRAAGLGGRSPGGLSLPLSGPWPCSCQPALRLGSGKRAKVVSGPPPRGRCGRVGSGHQVDPEMALLRVGAVCSEPFIPAPTPAIFLGATLSFCP